MLSSFKCTFWCIIVQNSMKTWDFWTGSWWKIFGVTNWAWLEFFISGCLVACSVIGYPVFYFILFKYKYLIYMYIFEREILWWIAALTMMLFLQHFVNPLLLSPIRLLATPMFSNVTTMLLYYFVLFIAFLIFLIF